jgi:hypothetical protein
VAGSYADLDDEESLPMLYIAKNRANKLGVLQPNSKKFKVQLSPVFSKYFLVQQTQYLVV